MEKKTVNILTSRKRSKTSSQTLSSALRKNSPAALLDDAPCLLLSTAAECSTKLQGCSLPHRHFLERSGLNLQWNQDTIECVKERADEACPAVVKIQAQTQ